MKPFKKSLLALLATAALLAPSALRAERIPAQELTEGPQLEDVRVDVDAPAVPGEYIVKFKSTTTQKARQTALQSHGGSIVNRIPALDSEVVLFPHMGRADAATKTELLKTLKQNPQIELIEPNYVYEGSYSPNDTSIGQQWAWGKIQANQAWDITRGSSSVIVAVVDSGVRRNHVDLDANMLAGGYDYVEDDNVPEDEFGHGTHVAGTIAAETNNSTGVAGTCPNCKMVSVRVLDEYNRGSMDDIANGIIYSADYGADVINLSLGGPSTSSLQNAVNYAWNQGSFLACAAGNSNTSSYANAYPAAYGNCFAIASTTSSDARSSFSNYGSWVELAAPGSSIYSTAMNGGYTSMNGTSMATPHVAAVAALLSSQGLSNAQIRDRLCSTADKISGTGTYWTCGRLNAFRAVSGTTPTPTPTVTSTPPTGSNAVVNGGFENGTTPWVQSSGAGYQIISTKGPRTGSYGAYFGDHNNANEKLYQTITVPSVGATLSYYYYVTTQESEATAYDYLRVRVYGASGTLLGTLKTYSNASTKNAWVFDSVSLASYAGQTIRIQFEATTDSSLPSAFYMDDVKTQ